MSQITEEHIAEMEKNAKQRISELEPCVDELRELITKSRKIERTAEEYMIIIGPDYPSDVLNYLCSNFLEELISAKATLRMCDSLKAIIRE